MKTPQTTERRNLPRVVVIIDTAFAVFLCGIGLYHFTQPHQAWRSGIVELVCAAALLAAAHLFGRIAATALNVAVAVVVFGIGIRHLISVAGWRSGTVELLLAMTLIVLAVVIYRHKPRRLENVEHQGWFR